MKYLNYYSTILEATQDQAQGATQGQVQGQAQGTTQSQAQGTTQSQAQGQADDQTAEKKAELDEANKKLEEKYPELKTIAEEFSKFIENSWKSMDESTIKRFGELMDEMTETEGFKEAMVGLRKIVKEVGILKSLKMIKNLISTTKMYIKMHRKVRKILSEGEKYNLCANEDSCSIIANPPEEDDDFAEFEELIEKIKNALTVKNLMNILTGKTDELELEYMTKAGKEAEGEIKNVEIKDDGSIEVSIENDKVGIIKKDLTEITAAGDDVDVSEDDLPKKLAEVQTKRPDAIKKVSNFVDFISNDTNKENSDKIYKIMGI